MPTKSTKKPATKSVAKKAPVKKTTKRAVKSAPVAAQQPVVNEVPMTTTCCHCTRRKKFFYLIVMFVLGILVGQLFCCCGHQKHPRVHFVNGCVDVTSVKCPKMLEQLPTMDANNDGCITRAELRAAKRAMRHQKEESVAEQPDVNVDDAIAPVME